MGRQMVFSLFKGREQSIDTSPEFRIELPTGAGSVVTGAMGVSSGGFSPLHVVVIALSGFSQLMTPFIVSGRQSGSDASGSKAQFKALSPEYLMEVPAAGASVVTGAVVTGSGVLSPRQVVVIALSG
jgi:hypothetical protein